MPASTLRSASVSTPSAQTGGARRRGERDQRLEQREAVRVVVHAVHERAVELEDVGRDADDLLQAGVAVAGVVERDPRAACAQPLELAVERLARSEKSSCSVSSITIPARSAGARRGPRGESSAPGLTLRARNVRSGRPCGASAARSAAASSAGAEPGAVRLVEPLVGRAERAVGHPRERLVAGDAPRRELEHRLEDRDDRVLALEQRLDLGALPVAGELAGEPAVVAAGSGRGRSAWPGRARRRRARAAAPRRARPPGTRPRRAEQVSGAPPTRDLRDRRARALGGLRPALAAHAGQDQRELLTAEPRHEVALAHGSSAASPPRRRAPCRPRRARRRR